ncbi:alpha-2-macroglobulin [Microvirga solisilvae]|uniref:alpha-2-macroglobulin n=1 Tax=Microvirga solisilvae TaxID=2919498 RepID=UPI001FAFF8DF|nr:MG2 domain-containing protein [Microvirga solisilvae]
MIRSSRFLGLVLVAVCGLAGSAQAQTSPASSMERDLVSRADGAKIVPEHFLQPWDPVTLFFDRDLGPQKGGPEDHPERVVQLTPDHPGAWQWIDARTLQFRPAEPWHPLRRVNFSMQNFSARLVPVLPAPVSVHPEDEEYGTADLDRFTLVFPNPIDQAALTRLLTIEVRPLPGVSDRDAQVLTAQDFTIKAVEKSQNSKNNAYFVTLRNPLPDGRMALLKLRLADEPGLDIPIYERRFRSASPFMARKVVCGSRLDDVERDGVLQCTPYGEGDGDLSSAKRSIILAFTHRPQELDVLQMREALRISPPVDDLTVTRERMNLNVSGKFLANTIYELRIEPGTLKDERGRELSGEAVTRRFSFVPEKPALVWDVNQGIVERFGPQMLPLRGRSYDVADIRIHKINPLARDFWPFPGDGLLTDDAAVPPLSGNEPNAWNTAEDIEADAMVERIRVLGSPAVSEIVPLPIRRGGTSAKFGVDIKPLLSKIAGPEQPGTYLIGLRPVDGGPRRWLRAQVTDLSLSAIEEAQRVRFAVTSLASAQPVDGAEIRLEGLRDDKFVVLAQGRTDAQGAFTWSLANRAPAEIKRVMVTKGLDTLVIEPTRAPAEYHQENWTRPEETWLSWATDPEMPRAEETRVLCHIFTERPIYRPEEPVHIKGFVRNYRAGGLSYATKGGDLVISGPSDQEWRIPVTPDANGGLYHKFDVATTATGDYLVRFETKDANEEGCGIVGFKKEAYRLPTFEVLLDSPSSVPLDGEFSVDLTARFFAGGLVADRPIKWRVTQFPHNWIPQGREGFLFSSDARYSSERKFRSTPVLEREGRTDDGGSARLTLDPTIEPTAQPRRYVIEATVTGDDDVQIRNTQNVVALPPFALGLKVPRYLPAPTTIPAELLAVDAKGDALSGLAMNVRFIKRNWNSVLQASDFSQGSAKYVTEVMDETLSEMKLTSARDILAMNFEPKGAGVYIIEVDASDRLGRKQAVSVDFFVGGPEPVTWSRPPTQTVSVASDKDDYAPGETAILIVQSPFQNGRALAVVEEPGGQFRYDWVTIQNGTGRYEVKLRKEQMPKLAVHFLLMRGRLDGSSPNPTAPFDQGKPVTLAATKWVTVKPVKHIVTASLEAPQKARPGQEVEVVLRLSDDTGKPVAGEATFWMVDQAVLSLAREQPLDPLKAFIVERPTQAAIRDTRNMAFGVIPLDETPGGDELSDDWGMENISVRKNFTPVPVYLPKVIVGPDGVARIKVKLPDTLTIYKLRAKAVSGPDRFGFAVGEMMIRQEIVAQPALPRFVRPGDQFDAGLIARVVEGPGGTGRTALSMTGGLLSGAAEQALAWQVNRPARLDFPVTVAEPKPGIGSDAAPMRLRFALQRDVDKAGDAVEIVLPVRPDRSPRREREIVEIAPGARATVAAPAQMPREGSYARTVTLASDPVLVRLLAGLNYLVAYPYGCTEQEIALASAALALKPVTPLLSAAGLEGRITEEVQQAARTIGRSIDDDGLVAFWPRAKGNVSLTAWSYTFLKAAERAGEPVDKTLIARLEGVLKQAMRSDYGRLLAGEELRERVEALNALAANNQLDQPYLTELSRRAPNLPVPSLAQVVTATARSSGAPDRQLSANLLEELLGRVKFLSRNGSMIYAGQAGDGGNPVILPSEVRNLSEVIRAVAAAAPEDRRLPVLRDGLINLSDANGWGSTHANTAAIQTLAEAWQRPQSPIPVAVTEPYSSDTAPLVLKSDAPMLNREIDVPTHVTLKNDGKASVIALVDTRYQPSEPGSEAAPVVAGFVLTREAYRVARNGSASASERLHERNLQLNVGDVIEEIVELVNPEDRTHVIVRLPLAAGLEPLNPALATAPAEATPSEGPTLAPTSSSFQDDSVLYAYDTLPKGKYRFVFRTRAQIVGSFTQPPGEVEMMYKAGVYGASAGRRVVIAR